jgi:hypothetical protein
LPRQCPAQAETEDSHEGKQHDRCARNSIALFQIVQFISVSDESGNSRLDPKVQ